ncbi:MAG: ATP-binding protein [Anaerolineae bacterium]|nr:ATP-binding protein [Anaerolineae bacterium]
MKRLDELVKRIGEDILRESTASTSSTEQETPGRDPAAEARPAECPFCKGLGYLRADVPIDHPDFGKLLPCSCRLAELTQRRAEALRSLSQLDALSHMTFDTFVPEGRGLTPEQQANLRWAYQEAREFALKPEGWLVLKGGYGCGKTHLAAAIANYCVEHGQPVLFVTVPDLLDYLRATFAPSSPARYSTRFEEIRTAPILILDDLGTESGTPWAQEKLFQIFNYRYNARLPTVITTNNELDEIPLRLRSRLGDPDLSRIVSIIAPDYRRAGVAQDQSDLSSLRLHAHQTFATFDLRKGELPPEEEENLARAVKLARKFAANPQGWLAFTGPYGVGKPHLAAAIANYCAEQGRAVLFVVVPDLLDHLRATFTPHSTVSFDQRFEEVRRAPLLVLDDLGTESATPWAREKLYQIFDYRYNACLPTVITTAVPIEELDQRLATRMLDVTRCTLFAILAPPYRGGQSKSKRSKR